MTADIVARLRDWLDEDKPIGVIMNEAADEIERLRAALREIAGCKTYSDREYMIGIARAALGGGDEPMA